MKISRIALKAVVKECLLELIAELVAGGEHPLPVRSERIERRRSPLDLKSPAHARSASATVRSVAPAPALREAIARESGGDPIMASIFADTAQTTLPRLIKAGVAASASPDGMENGGVAVPGDAAARAVAMHAPEQLFGNDVTDKWAHLAFADHKPGSTARAHVALSDDDT
jgi:hypothetical protein